MPPRLRKFMLTLHVMSSVGLLGAIAAFLALAIAGLGAGLGAGLIADPGGQDAQTIRAAYPAMQVITRFVVMPLAIASLLTGLIQSLGTSWGLFRHYWVVVKLLLTVFAVTILLLKIALIDHAARLATEAILPHTALRAAAFNSRSTPPAASASCWCL